MRRLHRGFTLLQLIVVVAIMGVFAVFVKIFILSTPYDDATWYWDEIFMQANGFKPSIEEKAAKDGTIASAGKGLTISTGGRVAGGSVTDAGLITITGNAKSIGTALSIVLTPSLGAGGRIAWVCSTNGDKTQWKYVRPECRH